MRAGRAMGGEGGRGRNGRGEIVLSADPARAVYVQSPMHGVHTWPKVLVWTPETLRASQSERDTSVPCCLYLNVVAELLAICCRYSGIPVYCNLL